MKEQNAAFIPTTNLSKGDVFTYQEDGIPFLNNCFLVDEISSIQISDDDELIATVCATDICSYEELFQISKKEFMVGNIGGEPEYHDVDLNKIYVIGHISADLEPDEDTISSVMEFEGIKLDFGETDEEREDKIMKDSFTNVIVDCPSVAADFLRSYQKADDISVVARAYDISERQVEDTIDRIKRKYAVRHNSY